MRWKRGRGEHPADLGMTNKFRHKYIIAKPKVYVKKVRISPPWEVFNNAVTYQEICMKNFFLKHRKLGKTRRQAFQLAEEDWKAQNKILVWT